MLKILALFAVLLTVVAAYDDTNALVQGTGTTIEKKSSSVVDTAASSSSTMLSGAVERAYRRLTGLLDDLDHAHDHSQKVVLLGKTTEHEDQNAAPLTARKEKSGMTANHNNNLRGSIPETSTSRQLERPKYNRQNAKYLGGSSHGSKAKLKRQGGRNFSKERENKRKREDKRRKDRRKKEEQEEKEKKAKKEAESKEEEEEEEEEDEGGDIGTDWAGCPDDCVGRRLLSRVLNVFW